MVMKVEVGLVWQLESNKLGCIVDDMMLGKVQGKLQFVVVEMDVLGGEVGIEVVQEKLLLLMECNKLDYIEGSMMLDKVQDMQMVVEWLEVLG